MAAKDADWTIFHTAFLIAAVLGGTLILSCWGGYGVGMATAPFGFIIMFAASLNCCCWKGQCLEKWPCQCCGCSDCMDLKTIVHARNTIVIAGIFASLGAIIVLMTSLVFLFYEGCKDSHCHSINGKLPQSNRCKQCWQPTWTTHPWRRWEWGLSEMCWASDLGHNIFESDEELSFGCNWYWKDEEHHDKEYRMSGPASSQECKTLCSCMDGVYEECGNEAVGVRVFGIVALANGLFSICFVIALFCACTAAGRIIHDDGGPLAVAPRVAALPVVGQPVGQVMGQPALGTPVLVAASGREAVETNPCA